MNLESDPKSDLGDRPISGAFHPFVYKLVAALAAWFVLSAWAFAGRGATDLALAVVTFVFLAGVGIPAVLGRIRRAHQQERPEDARPDEARPDKDRPDDQPTTETRDNRFGDWAGREVDLSTGPVKGRLATLETILPIAAVAFGMTAFALVLHFVES